MPRGPRGAIKGPTIECPSCQQTIKARHPDQFRQHVGKCCPDVLVTVEKKTWTCIDAAFDAVTAYEQELLTTAKSLAYAPGNRLHVTEVAKRMNLPLPRVKGIFRKASKAIPLVADSEPLSVIFEDHELLVVNKPPGLRFHPTHRFEGNSLLSRCLGHVRRGKVGDNNVQQRIDAAVETVTEPGTGTADTDTSVANTTPDSDAPKIVHRLDMDTSGVCLFVKDGTLVDGFARQFRGEEESKPFGRAIKEYLALCVGHVPQGNVVRVGDTQEDSQSTPDDQTENMIQPSWELKSFTVDAHIGAHASIPEARWVHPPPPPVPKHRPGGHPDMDPSIPKHAETKCAVLSQSEFGFKTSAENKKLFSALVRAQPSTGRTHQIRIHLAHAQLPILSDALYGPHIKWGGASPAENRGDAESVFREKYMREENEKTAIETNWGGDLWLGRQALHAQRLTITHPRTGEKLKFHAPMPEDMRKACVALGVDPNAAEE